MNTLTKLTAVILSATAMNASAFFGDDSNQNGYSNFLGDSIIDTRGRGAGTSSADAEGNFSMSINASGKGSTKATLDLDGTNNSHGSGSSDIRTESIAYQYK